jgi:phosphohistidine phosphatase SixA
MLANTRFCTYAADFVWLFAGFFMLYTPAQAQNTQDAALQALKQGGHVLIMRHAQTVSGIGDPPNFKLGDCSTQRNLNEIGREQARALGERLRKAGVKFDAVHTSAWCRCVDTAKLAFSVDARTAPQVFAPLNSTFNDRTQMPNRTEEVRAKLKAWRGAGNMALVTHMVNVQSLTNETLGMGEVIVVKPVAHAKDGFEIIGRLTQ